MDESHNPYVPSAMLAEEDQQHTGRVYDQSRSNFAKLSWMAPLVGLAISFAINMMATPLRVVGGVVFIGTGLAGFVIAIISLFLARKYSHTLRHALGGLFTCGVLVALMGAAWFAIAGRARDAAEQLRERELQFKQEAEEMERMIQELEAQQAFPVDSDEGANVRWFRP